MQREKKNQQKTDIPRDLWIPEEICVLDLDPIIFENIRSLYYKNRDVFSQSDDDIGYTTTEIHRIRLTDEQRVSQAHRRIPSSQFEAVKQQQTEYHKVNWWPLTRLAFSNIPIQYSTLVTCLHQAAAYPQYCGYESEWTH